MKIKILYLSDYPECAIEVQKCLKEQWGDFYPNRTLEAWKEELYFNKNALPITLIACDVSTNPPFRVVGCASLCWKKSYKTEDMAIWLERVLVIPTERGKNIGSILIDNCIKVAEKSNIITNQPIEEIQLLTRHAENLYVKYGWSKIDTIQYQGGPVSVMVRKLQFNKKINNITEKLIFLSPPPLCEAIKSTNISATTVKNQH